MSLGKRLDSKYARVRDYLCFNILNIGNRECFAFAVESPQLSR